MGPRQRFKRSEGKSPSLTDGLGGDAAAGSTGWGKKQVFRAESSALNRESSRCLWGVEEGTPCRVWASEPAEDQGPGQGQTCEHHLILFAVKTMEVNETVHRKEQTTVKHSQYSVSFFFVNHWILQDSVIKVIFLFLILLFREYIGLSSWVTLRTSISVKCDDI